MGKTPAQEMARKLEKTKKKMKEEAAKNKVKEDKAFGLKNQKGAKQAINVDRLRAMAAKAGRTQKQIREEEKKRAEQAQQSRLKKEAEKLGMTVEELVTGKKVVTKKGFTALAPGQDPKTVLCGFFKAGKCKQGKKCKFSHDPEVERKKKDKKSLYTDPRLTDTMDKWDQDKLELVVKQKDGKVRQNATMIVCKYFINAIETKKYGWFWKCENGDDCMYQHRLPPGFILKSDIKKEDEEEAEDFDIGEDIERERSMLDLSKCTPITPETFAAWKEKQKLKKLEAVKVEIKAVKKKKAKRGHGMTGRTLFTYDPTMFVDDAEAAGDEDLQFEEEEGAETAEEPEDPADTKDWVAPANLEQALFLETADLQPEEIEVPEEAPTAALADMAISTGDKEEKKDKKKKDKKEAKVAPAPAAAAVALGAPELETKLDLKVAAAPEKKEKKKLTKAEKLAKKAEEKAAKAAKKAAEAAAKLAEEQAALASVCKCRGSYLCTACRKAEEEA